MNTQELERLLIRIVGDSSGAQAEVGKAVRAVADAQKRINANLGSIDRGIAGVGKQFQTVTRLAGAFGLALGVRGLTNFTRGALDAAGGLGELSQQLGVGIEQLQVYMYAATQAGLSQSDLQVALAKLSRTIGEAALGEKEAVEAFKAIGVSVVDAQGHIRSTDAVMRDLAQRFAEMPDDAREAALAVDLFGKSGQKMLPILEGGAAGLRKFEERARSLGLVLTKQQSDAADKAADKWSEFGQLLERVFQISFAKIAPAISDLFDTLTSPEITSIIQGIADAVAGAIEFIVKVLDTAAEAIQTVVRWVNEAWRFIESIFGSGQLEGMVHQILPALDETDDTLKKITTTAGGTKDALKALTAAAEEAQDALVRQSLLTEAAKQGEAATRELTAALAAIDAINKAVTGSNRPPDVLWGTDDLRTQVELVKALAGPTKLATNAFNAEAEAIAEAVFQTQALADATIDAKKRADLWAEAMGSGADAAAEAAKKFADDVRRVSEGIADDLATALFDGGKNGFDDIIGNIGEWARRLGIELLKQQIILPITTELVGGLPGLFGISGAGGNGQTLFGAIGGLATDAFDWLGRQLGFGSQTRAQVGADGRLTGGNSATGGYVEAAGGGFDIGQVIGAAVQGAALGQATAGLYGASGQVQTRNAGYGALAGSTIASAVAAYYSGGNPLAIQLAGAAGGQLGSFLGGLFGPGPSSGPFGLGTAKTSGGRLTYSSTQNLKGGIGDLSPLVNETIGVANQLADIFGAEYASQANIRIGYVNSESGKKGYVVSGSGRPGTNDAFNKWKNFGEDKTAAELFAIRQVVLGGSFNGLTNGPGLQGLTDQEKQYLTKSFSIRGSSDEVLKDAALIVDLFSDQAEAMSEAAAAIKQVNDAYETQIKRAQELGIAESVLEQRRQDALNELRTGFVEGIQDQILAISDPLAFALKQLDKEFETIRQNAEDFGVGMVEVEQLYGLKRQQVIEQIARATVSDLQKFLENLIFGDLSGASPTARLEGSRAAFEAAAAQALAGDATARGRIQDLGTTFLGESRGYNASSGAYYADVERVRSIVEQLLGDAPGFARGTLSAPGGLAWVGEQGRELMTLPRGAGILPNSISEAIAGRAANSDGWRPLLRVQLDGLAELRGLRTSFDKMAAEQRNQGSAIRRLQAKMPPAAA